MSVQRFSVPVKSTYYNMRIREGYDQYGNHDILSLSLNPINMNSESSYDAEGGLFERFSRKRGSSPRGKVSRKSKEYEIGLRDLTKYIPGYKKGDLDEELFEDLSTSGREKISNIFESDILEQIKNLTTFHKQFEEDAKSIETPEIQKSFNDLKLDHDKIVSLIDKKQKTAFVAAIVVYGNQPSVSTVAIRDKLKNYYMQTNLYSGLTTNQDDIHIFFPDYFYKWFSYLEKNDGSLIEYLKPDLPVSATN